jgi:hypothetical protein
VLISRNVGARFQPARQQHTIQLSIAEPMNKTAASQHACPFRNISEDRAGTRG